MRYTSFRIERRETARYIRRGARALVKQFTLITQDSDDRKAADGELYGGEVKARTKRGSLTVRIEPNTQPQLRFSGGGGIILPNTPKVRDFLIRLYMLAQSLGYAA